MKLGALLAGVAAMALAAPALAQVNALTVFVHKEAVGELIGDTKGDTTQVTYHWASNGRGPALKETIRIGADAQPIGWTVSGASMMGGAVTEKFERTGNRVVWTSASDKGDQVLTGQQLYLATDASPWQYGVAAQALVKASGMKLPAVTGGEISLVKIRQVTLGTGPKAIPVTVYRLDGLDYEPTYVMLDAAGKFFGWFPQSSSTGMGVRKGYEAVQPQVDALGGQLEQERIEQISKDVTHRFSQPVRFRNVRVLDVRTGKLGAPSSVVVNGERIVRIMALSEDTAADAKGDVVIEGEGGTLMPGLYDMHAHAALDSGLYELAAGITSIREMGNYNDFFLKLRPMVESGLIAGPRMTPSGILEGHSEYALNMGFKPNSLEEALADVHWYADHGYDLIKFYSSFTPAWVKPVAAEAHRLGLKAGGHIPAFTNADEMIAAGYDSVTHENLLLFDWLLPKEADTRTLLRATGLMKAANLDLNSEAVKKTIAMMKANHVTVDPTTIILERLMLSRAGMVQVGDVDYLDHVPAAVQRRRKRTSLPIANAQEDADYKKGFQNALALIGVLDKNGIQVLAGTDDAYGFALHREIELYTLAGIPAPKAIRMATLGAEEYFGRPIQSGVVEKGMYADLVLITGDPTQNIKAIKQPRLVMKGGAVFLPAEIYPRLGVKPFAQPPKIMTPAS
jgi:imidazolonepropionase-like amidohydrolase